MSYYIRYALIALLIIVPLTLRAGEAANLLDQAEVVLRIRDGKWVERESTRWATSYSADPVGLRGEVARVLYRSTSFAGIDLARPATIAWRRGRAPLLAAIPITDRVVFLGAFGEVDDNEPPLVRTGERDGTVVYTQNQPDGLWEYRLLVLNGVAYLARNADECRRLAAAHLALVEDSGSPPLELCLRGRAIANPNIPGSSWLGAFPSLPIDTGELGAVPGLLSGVLTTCAEQLSALNISLRPLVDGDVQLGIRITAKPETAFAAWLAQQRGSTERLPNQLRTANTAMLLTGRLAFQGQLERWSFDQADLLQTTAKEYWTQPVDSSYRSLCTLIERTGAFSLNLERQEVGILRNVVLEHSRAMEVSQAYAQVAAALRGSTCETIPLGERTAYRVQTVSGSSLFAAGERHVIRCTELSTNRAQVFVLDALRRLDEQGKLDEVPSIVSLWLDLSLAWNVPPIINTDGERERHEPVIIIGSVRSAGANRLEALVKFPLTRIAALLSRITKPNKHEP